MLKEIGFAHPGRGKYLPLDRFRDFRDVFFGTDAGKRVLYEILSFTRMFQPVAVKGDPHETYRRDGERNVGLKILYIANTEPKPLPTKANSQQQKGD
ncbi:MAG: hypothetical protein NUW21_07625, partial [Elusimicrobia bacterium]|nr:hypothetical protein [Elusimicrobiota bacterium]